MRGSKYVQSIIGNSYSKAKEFLDLGKPVLFSGTPCQIAGLYTFLEKEYDNLVTQDLICHGVPSPLIWNKYLSFVESSYSSEVNKVAFRDKKYGWKNYSTTLNLTNGKKCSKLFTADYYSKAFLNNLSLRPSCYKCAFKSIGRKADITLADFWGVQAIEPNMDDNKGTSLIFIHTKKGMNVLDEIRDELIIKNVDINDSIKYNSSMVESVAIPSSREDFISELQFDNFDSVLKKYCKTRKFEQQRTLIRLILSKVKRKIFKL